MKASFNSPMGRYILGGATTGAAAGAYAGGEDNRGKGALVGALAGGFGGGALGDVLARSKLNKFKEGDTLGLQRSFESPTGKLNDKIGRMGAFEYHNAAYDDIPAGNVQSVSANAVDDFLARGGDYTDASEIAREAAIRNTNLARTNKKLNDKDIRRLRGLADERGARAESRALIGTGIGSAGLGAAAYSRGQQEKEAHVFRKLAEKQEQEKSAALYANYRYMRGY